MHCTSWGSVKQFLQMYGISLSKKMQMRCDVYSFKKHGIENKKKRKQPLTDEYIKAVVHPSRGEGPYSVDLQLCLLHSCHILNLKPQLSSWLFKIKALSGICSRQATQGKRWSFNATPAAPRSMSAGTLQSSALLGQRKVQPHTRISALA